MNKAAVNFKKTFDVLGHGLMYRPTELGDGMRIPGGPLQGAVMSTGLGAGAGYGAGSLVNLWSGDNEEKKKQRARRWAIIGALAAGLPAIVKSYGMASSTIPQQGLVNGLVDVRPDAELATKEGSMGWVPVTAAPAVNMIASDNQMTPFAKALSIQMVLDAERDKPGSPLSFGQLAKAGVGAGLGVLGGTMMARVLTDLLGLPQPGTRTFMQRGGGLGGALVGAGFVQ